MVRIRGIPGRNLYTLAIGIPILSVLAFLAASAPGFLTLQNAVNLPGQIVPFVIVGVGQLFVVAAAGIDLSIGSVISLTTCIVASDLPWWISLPAALAAGAMVGLVNGIGVVFLRVHPLIMTLATSTVVQGLAYAIRAVPGGRTPAGLVELARGDIAGVPLAAIWLAGVLLAAWLLLVNSPFGLRLRAVGANADAANLNGVGAAGTTISAYMLCSLCGVACGLYFAGIIASADPNIGMPYALDSLTVLALAGVSLAGGVANVPAAAAGGILLGLINNAMNYLGIPAFAQGLVKGAILLTTVAIQRRATRGL
jgi:ribose transport system permease protein